MKWIDPESARREIAEADEWLAGWSNRVASRRQANIRDRDRMTEIRQKRDQLALALQQQEGALYPTEPPTGTVLRWARRFLGTDRVYVYVAVHTNDGWLTTSKVARNLPVKATWEQLRDFLIAGGELTADTIAYAEWYSVGGDRDAWTLAFPDPHQPTRHEQARAAGAKLGRATGESVSRKIRESGTDYAARCQAMTTAEELLAIIGNTPSGQVPDRELDAWHEKWDSVLGADQQTDDSPARRIQRYGTTNPTPGQRQRIVRASFGDDERGTATPHGGGFLDGERDYYDNSPE